MTFNEEQMKALAAYEEHFRTAIKAQWAKNPGRTGLRVIWEIYTQATGDTRRFNDNCSHCILNLLHDCGTIYYRDLEEMARRAVKVSDEAARPVGKKRINTAK